MTARRDEIRCWTRRYDCVAQATMRVKNIDQHRSATVRRIAAAANFAGPKVDGSPK